MEYTLNYATISYFGISPGIFGELFEFNIFDELDFLIRLELILRKNSRERNLFNEADYMRKLVPLGRDKKCPNNTTALNAAKKKTNKQITGKNLIKVLFHDFKLPHLCYEKLKSLI